MGILSLLQEIFLTQELNQRLLHCKQILYQLGYQESPMYVKMQESGLTEIIPLIFTFTI